MSPQFGLIHHYRNKNCISRTCDSVRRNLTQNDRVLLFQRDLKAAVLPIVAKLS